MTKQELAKAIMWMMDKGYATGHGDSVVDLLQELEWQVAEREREACAKVCEELVLAYAGNASATANQCADAIRARGENTRHVDAVNMGQERVDETAKRKHEWVGLTLEEINEVLGSDIHDEPSGELKFIRAIEAKLKEKNE